MQSGFDPYDFVGVIAPGAIVAFVSMLVFPELQPIFLGDGFSVGALGLFVIVSFCIGHLVQGLGNGLEKLVWYFFGGMPTNWVIKEKQTLISSEQRALLAKRVRALISDRFSFAGLSSKEWYSITRQIYAHTRQRGLTDRIDTFNRNYGFLRGIATAFPVSALLLAFSEHEPDYRYWVLLALGFVAALYRMFRFGRTYARELFVVFLALPVVSDPQGASK